MNSKNGTYVDKKQIDMEQIVDGSVIDIGEYSLIFKAKDISSSNNDETINIVDIHQRA